MRGKLLLNNILNRLLNFDFKLETSLEFTLQFKQEKNLLHCLLFKSKSFSQDGKDLLKKITKHLGQNGEMKDNTKY